MGKKKLLKPDNVAAAAPTKIRNYDQNSIKQLLDDVIMKIVFEEQDYEEDLTLSNLKIALGFISCLVAVWSHFNPYPFPDNVGIIKACVATYLICALALQYIAFFKEGNLIIVTKPNRAKNGRVKIKGLEVATEFPRYQDKFIVKIGVRGANEETHELEESVGKWFTVDGTFVEEAFAADIRKLLAKAERSD
ncbi:hypothetical protein QOT17_005963 [Balamuthia mandrillaris]